MSTHFAHMHKCTHAQMCACIDLFEKLDVVLMGPTLREVIEEAEGTFAVTFEVGESGAHRVVLQVPMSPPAVPAQSPLFTIKDSTRTAHP